MKDPSTDVKLTVIDGLSQWTPLTAPELNILSSALRDKDYIVRARAAGVLRESGVEPPEGSPSRAEGMGVERMEQLLRDVRSVTRARIETSKGILLLDLYPDQAPFTVANFARLARRGYFDEKAWHRVVPDFVVQDGCPRGDGWGGPGYSIRCEINTYRYGSGALGMALSGKDTGGSQYFITHSPQPHLDGGYTVFGRLRSGWDVLLTLAPGDRIERVVVEGSP